MSACRNTRVNTVFIIDTLVQFVYNYGDQCPVYCSENESTIGKEDRKRKARSKRRKTIDKAPCLTILSYDKENEEVECLLEFSNRNSVTFKFDTEGDKPEEIAESLVCRKTTDYHDYQKYSFSHHKSLPYLTKHLKNS